MKEVFIGNYGLEQVGQKMTATGWVANIRNHGKLAFIELRDREGLLQIFVAGDSPAFTEIEHLHKEDVISVTGEVVKREARFVNKAIKSGQVELRAEKIQILASSKPLPFELDQHAHTGEELRQKYRYLDLRRGKMTENLKLRHQVTSTIRDYLNGKDFLEVETPYLTKSTPEGARDFLVPSRVFKNQFYALPQSPQMLKQLLMGAGLERYYQVVRCFRDEDLRGDRQPEFTQVDMELSFASAKDIRMLVEEMLKAVVKKTHGLELTEALGSDILTLFNQSSSMYSFFEFVLFQLVAWFYEVHVLASILDSLSFFQVRCYVYELFISMLIHIRDSSTGLASTHDRITNLDHFKPPFYTFYLPFYNLKVVEFFVIC